MFEPVVDNPDLSIHPSPKQPRVAVVCRWRDAHRFREKHYPDVAVVGPLRTVRGIDLLLRNLLANPQIRIVTVDGVDLTPDESTTKTLFALWRDGLRPKGLGEDLTDELVDVVRDGVVLIDGTDGTVHAGVDWDLIDDERGSRPGGRVVLPPPPPVATTVAPHGDPGERVTGATLSEVWPRVLQRILDFGRTIPSKYGQTKELLSLVSVVRDPRAAVEEAHSGDAEWLGFTVEEMEDYAKRVTTPWKPEGAEYSYGTRIGEGGFGSVVEMLMKRPGDRGIGVSPWLPHDAAGGKGRPCLVWCQFRLVEDELHLQVVFRSHDYFAAYPMNLVALATWLLREADWHSFEVGTMTCLSVSAHLYDRDWNAAREVVEAHLPKGHLWDRRTSWRVESLVDGVCDYWGTDDHCSTFEQHRDCKHVPRKIRATALTPDGIEVVATFEGRTAMNLQKQIERTGLVTSVGAGIWLGRELQKAEGR